MDNKLNVKRVTIVLIKRAMTLHRGNKTHAAKSLGLSLRALRYWIAKNEDLHIFKGEAPSSRSCGRGNHIYNETHRDDRLAYLYCVKCSQYTRMLWKK